MRVSDGVFACSYCGDRVVTLQALVGSQPPVTGCGVVDRDDGTPPYVAVEFAGGGELRHDCAQIPADILAQLADTAL